MGERVVAPFGRRLCEVTRNLSSGGYRIFSALDPAGPAPAAGQFYMLAADAGWGGEEGRPYLARAFSVADAERESGGVRLDFLVQAVGPGTARLAQLEPGEGLWIHGPLGRPFSAPSALAEGAPGAILVGGGIGVAPLAIWRRQLLATGVPARILLGFRDRAKFRRPRAFSIAARSGWPVRTGTAGTAATSPTCSPCCSRGTTRAALRSMPAGRPQCSRRSGRSARIETSPASWPWRPRWPVGSVPASAAPSRSAPGGTCASAWMGPWCAATRSRPLWCQGRAIDGRVLRPRAPPPGHQRLGHLRRARGAPSLRRSAARRVPLLGLRLQDDHPGAARGQPTTSPLGDPLRTDQLDRAAEQGPRRLPRARSAAARRAAGPPDRLGDGDQPRRVRRAGRGGGWPSGGRGPRAQRLLPEREVGADRRRIARGGALPAPAAAAADGKTPAREAHPEHRGPGPRRAGGRGGRCGRRLADQHAAGGRLRPRFGRSMAGRRYRWPLGGGGPGGRALPDPRRGGGRHDPGGGDGRRLDGTGTPPRCCARAQGSSPSAQRASGIRPPGRGSPPSWAASSHGYPVRREFFSQTPRYPFPLLAAADILPPRCRPRSSPPTPPPRDHWTSGWRLFGGPTTSGRSGPS